MEMKRFIPEINNLEDWSKLLADPVLHWKEGYSAYELANSWVNSDAFPPLVEEVLNNSGFDELNGLAIDVLYPERKTSLNDAGRPSQTDLMVFATERKGKVVIAVEGKVDEPFGPLVSERNDGGEATLKRLNFLCQELGLPLEEVMSIRYQLLHRSCAGILEAEKINATTVLFLVHSFSDKDSSFNDYQAFLSLFNKKNVIPNKIFKLARLKEIHFFSGWIKDKKSP